MDSPHHHGDRYPRLGDEETLDRRHRRGWGGQRLRLRVVVATVVGSVWVASCRMGSVAEG